MSEFRRTEHQKLDLPESQKPDSTKNDSGLAVFRPRVTAATERRSASHLLVQAAAARQALDSKNPGQGMLSRQHLTATERWRPP